MHDPAPPKSHSLVLGGRWFLLTFEDLVRLDADSRPSLVFRLEVDAEGGAVDVAVALLDASAGGVCAGEFGTVLDCSRGISWALATAWANGVPALGGFKEICERR